MCARRWGSTGISRSFGGELAATPLARADSLGFRRVAPPGRPRWMRLKTKVAKGPNGLVLSKCGPLLYRPVLEDESGVNWKDRVLVEVTGVAAKKKRTTVKLIEVLKI